MDTPLPDADKEQLSIADLEELLAAQRRRQGRRLLRSAAGYGGDSAPSAAAAGRVAPGLARPAVPAPPTTPLVEDGPGARMPQPTVRLSPPVRPPPPDRFHRPRLIDPQPGRPLTQPGGGTVPRRPATPIDRALQLAEVGIVLVLLVVLGEWFYTSFFVTDTDLSDVMAGPTLAAYASPVRTRSATPLRTPTVRPGAAVANLTLTATPAPPSLTPAPSLSLAPSLTPAPPTSAPSGGRVEQAPALIRPDYELAAEMGLAAPPIGPPTATRTPSPTPSQTGTPTATATITVTPTPSATAPPSATATATSTPDPALDLPTRLIIPKIKLDSPVRGVRLRLAADQATWDVADYAVGHHLGTANPGEEGNVVMAGHRDIHGKVFYYLDKLAPGDEIFVHSGHGVYRYVVRAVKIIKPTQVEVMAPTADSRLTLITCTPIGLATSRLVVIADLDPSYTGENN